MNTGNRRNRQKHLSHNPLQRALVHRFHQRVAELAQLALSARVSSDRRGARPAAVRAAMGAEAATALEVGCGEGFVLSYLQGQAPSLRCHGVDYDAAAVTEAAQRNPSVPMTVADITALPFADRSFPLVLCLEVLEHLRDPRSGLSELERVSDGYLLLSVPNQPFFALANFMRGKNWRTLGDDPEHVQHWTGPAFVALVRSRLQVMRVTYSFPWVIVLGHRVSP